VGYAVFELKAQKHREDMETFVRRRPLYQTLALRAALEEGDAYKGWWFGAMENGELEALVSIVGTKANIHASSGDAAEAVARTLLGNQKHNKSAAAHRHEVMGDERTMARFWPTFREIDRKVLVDQPRFLMGGGGDNGPLESCSKRMILGYATHHHQRLMEDFLGEVVLEKFGVDPRRSNRAAHNKNVAALIASGRQLLGYEKDKPVFVAELVDINDTMVELQNVWVPVALRSRKRLIGGAFAQATALPHCQGKEVLVMAANTGMHEAAKRAGMEQRAAFRFVAMIGH